VKVKKITFVCTGNTCRSVMAERLFRQIAKKENLEIDTDSAGTAAMPHYTIFGDLQLVMEENGIDYRGHIPTLVSKDVLENTDLVLVMTKGHKEEINSRFPEYIEKVYMLSEYAGDGEKDIADPIGMGADAYRKAFGEIKYYLEKIVEKIKDES